MEKRQENARNGGLRRMERQLSQPTTDWRRLALFKRHGGSPLFLDPAVVVGQPLPGFGCREQPLFAEPEHRTQDRRQQQLPLHEMNFGSTARRSRSNSRFSSSVFSEKTTPRMTFCFFSQEFAHVPDRTDNQRTASIKHWRSDAGRAASYPPNAETFVASTILHRI